MATRGPWTGKVLGERYLLGDLLGAGGVGEVYEAVDQQMGRRVAIKVLHQERNEKDDALARLEREARTIGSLEHPNIVQVIDFKSPSEGPAFMVMDLLRGRSLDQAIEEDGPLSEQRIAFVVDQVLDALTAVHETGIIHRDLKPHNIFLTSIAGSRTWSSCWTSASPSMSSRTTTILS